MSSTSLSISSSSNSKNVYSRQHTTSKRKKQVVDSSSSSSEEIHQKIARTHSFMTASTNDNINQEKTTSSSPPIAAPATLIQVSQGTVASSMSIDRMDGDDNHHHSNIELEEAARQNIQQEEEHMMSEDDEDSSDAASDQDNGLGTLSKKVVQQSLDGDEEYYARIKKEHEDKGSPPCWKCKRKNYKGKESKFFTNMEAIINDYSPPTLQDHIKRVLKHYNKKFVNYSKQAGRPYIEWTEHSIMQHILYHDMNIDKIMKLSVRYLNLQLRNLEQKHLRFKFKGCDDIEGINKEGSKRWDTLVKLGMQIQTSQKK